MKAQGEDKDTHLANIDQQARSPPVNNSSERKHIHTSQAAEVLTIACPEKDGAFLRCALLHHTCST